MTIWETLSTLITILAPMEDVTDTVFRQIITQTARPSLFFTEFTNVDGLLSEYGYAKVSQRLRFLPIEKPLIAQIWGVKPEKFYEAAKKIAPMGFDGIDLNMGCPVGDVVKIGGGGGCIGDNERVKEIIKATREGAGDLPVSVKTRIGRNKIITDEWIGFLLEQKLPALSVHLRTIKEQSAVPAHWEEMEKIVKMKNDISPKTKIIGNGDVSSFAEIKERVETYGCDGVMVGRGIFHNPWLFDQTVDPQTKMLADRLELLKKHVVLFDQTWNGINNKPYKILKKYFKIYLSDFDGASAIREKFMMTETPQEALELVNTYC